MVPVLERFNVDDLVEASRALRHITADARSMEDAARRLVRYLYDGFVDAAGAPASVLVRVYKTHAYADLPPDLQEFAHDMGGSRVMPATRCLTLLATAGREAAWNDRHRSEGHQAVPLTSEAAVEESPMIAALLDDMGFDIAYVVEPDPDLVIERHHEIYNVFHVPDARGSVVVPAQDFVERYGIRSVVGFGGALPTGDVFATILFTTVSVTADVADLFRTLAVAAKAALVRHSLNVFGSPLPV